GTRSGPGEEVEIAAEIRLGDALDIEPAITARRLFRRLPGGTTARELGLVDQEIDLAGGGVEADTVAVAYQRERTAGGRFRRHVQHDGAERGAAHARVRDAHHVLDAFGAELLRDRQGASLRHTGCADRAGIA